MPSPFPGMDPYLEDHWRDVHARLIIYITDAIQDQLPGQLRARVEERVVMETPEGMGPGLFPDVRVTEYAPRPGLVVVSPARGTMSRPLLIEAGDTLTEGFIQVIDSGSGNRVVTVLEVLSPTNKLPGDGRDQYRRKQRDLCGSDTNLVEIDLLRQGQHVAAVPRSHIPPDRRTPYLVCVRRATARGLAEVYPIGLREPLPTIQVPLRPQDADVALDLQALIQQVYQRGRYDGDLDYKLDPTPPLDGADAAWADRLLREKGLRAPPPKRRRKKPPNGS